MRLALWLAVPIFLAIAIIVAFNNGSWQVALILAAISIGIAFFLIKG